VRMARERIWLFREGWRKRSAMILDAAGCPLWLIKLRCPTIRGWGSVLEYFVDVELARGKDER
jgi:hypothetical protein